MNAGRYQQLLDKREVLESTYGDTLSFEPLAGRQSCRVADYREDSSIEDEAGWEGFIEWFVDSQRRIREAIHACGGLPAAGA